MRTIYVEELIDEIAQLCIKANIDLPEDVRHIIELATVQEDWETASHILLDIQKNHQLSEKNSLPICQDTGMALVFLEIGQDVHLIGDIDAAIQAGIKKGYAKGYLRNSMVEDPLIRENTNDNTPALIYYDLVPGEKIKITIAPKGFGSENMSQIKMLKPSDGREGVENFILQVVKEAGPNACPPIIVGVGIGASFDRAALLAKKALLLDLEKKNPNPYYAEMEESLLQKINELGIGPQGFGGKTTALAVKILPFATHIAGLPVAVNIQCHVARHATTFI